MKFVVLKIEKTSLKDLNEEEEHGQTENEESEAFKRVINLAWNIFYNRDFRCF